MLKRLKFTLMASPAIATALCLSPCSHGASNAAITATTDDSGHTVYVNDVVARARFRYDPGSASSTQFRSQQNRLVFWSITEHRWKMVPHANIRAARSAAAEVDHYLDKPSGDNSSLRGGLTQAKIDELINQAASRHNVDPALVKALVKVESNFNPNAVSRKGAMGLMQLMPQTARRLNLSNPFDPAQNVDAGVRHLKDLLDSYGGDVPLTLAAYNAGSGAVARSQGIPRYAETRNYVKRITQIYGGSLGGSYFQSVSHEPVRVQRDSRGVLYISNTD